jgi:hypothetical protein
MARQRQHGGMAGGAIVAAFAAVGYTWVRFKVMCD